MTKPGSESPVCPICQTRKFLTPFYSGITTWEYPGQFSYLRCSRCGLILQSPRVPLSQIGKFYKPSAYWGRDITRNFRYPHYLSERQKHYGPVYEGITLRKSPGRILDVGSGLGLFLSLFKEKGWEVLGTETNKEVAVFSQKTFSVPVRLGDLTRMDLPKNYYDVITFIGVFEHIYNPDETLDKVRTLLRQDGLLIIVPPNIESLGHFIFKSRWYSLEPGRHLYLYSPKTLTRLLHDHGFKVETISHAHWVYNTYSLFLNLRYYFSPRPAASSVPASAASASPKFSLVREFGKPLAHLLSYLGAFIEPLIGRGESMIVYARKT